MEAEGELIFTNMVGMRVLQQRFEDFVALLEYGRIKLLDCGASFSRSLARAVDINSSADVDNLFSAVQQQDRHPPAQPIANMEEQDANRAQSISGSEHPDSALHLTAGGEAVSRVNQEPAPVALSAGTWLGFHDCESPLLARFAMYDQESKTHIFVNRNGIKLRQLSNSELLDLIAQGQVEILETSSNFRDEINSAKQRSEN